MGKFYLYLRLEWIHLYMLIIGENLSVFSASVFFISSRELSPRGRLTIGTIFAAGDEFEKLF